MSTLSTEIQTVETDVTNFFVKFFSGLKQEAQTVETDFLAALSWVQSHGQEIAASVTSVIGVVAAAGVGIPPSVLTASTLLNEGVTAVNNAIAAAQAQQAAGQGVGTQSVAALAAGYQSFNKAKSTLATAPATAAS